MEKIPFDQEKSFIEATQCVAYNLYNRGVEIRNVTWFFDTVLLKIGQWTTYGEYIEKLAAQAEKCSNNRCPTIVICER